MSANIMTGKAGDGGGEIPFTQPGDLYTRNDSGENVVLPIPTSETPDEFDGFVLTIDSAEPEKLKWAAPAEGGGTLETVYDLDIGALPNQDLHTDGDHNVAGVIWKSAQNASLVRNDIQNGLGLVLTGGSSESRDAAGITIPFENISPTLAANLNKSFWLWFRFGSYSIEDLHQTQVGFQNHPYDYATTGYQIIDADEHSGGTAKRPICECYGTRFTGAGQTNTILKDNTLNPTRNITAFHITENGFAVYHASKGTPGWPTRNNLIPFYKGSFISDKSMHPLANPGTMLQWAAKMSINKAWGPDIALYVMNLRIDAERL